MSRPPAPAAEPLVPGLGPRVGALALQVGERVDLGLVPGAMAVCPDPFMPGDGSHAAFSRVSRPPAPAGTDLGLGPGGGAARSEELLPGLWPAGGPSSGHLAIGLGPGGEGPVHGRVPWDGAARPEGLLPGLWSVVVPSSGRPAIGLGPRGEDPGHRHGPGSARAEACPFGRVLGGGVPEHVAQGAGPGASVLALALLAPDAGPAGLAPSTAAPNDVEAVRAYADALRGGGPMAAPHVVPVPGHEPTPIEAAGLAQWLATDMHAATVADLRRRLSAEVARAQGAAKRSTPHASNPAAFGQGTAARYAQTPLLAELRVPPPVDSGAAPKVDRAALIALHSQNCQTCKGGAGSFDCYGVVMAHVATGFDVTHAWIDGPPPTERLWPAPGSSDDPWTSARGTGAGSVPSKADEVLDGLVNKLRGSGVIFERDADAKGVRFLRVRCRRV